MAMYHLSTKPIKRSDGRSATASAAYRAAEKIYDKRTGLTHDYSKKTGVVDSSCFVLKDNKMLVINRSELWNAAESAEKRKDGRTAREVIVSLPHEMTDLQRYKLIEEFTIDIAKKYGVAIDYAIHRPDTEGDQRNHHCHIMMTTRSATLENGKVVLGAKTNLELSNTKLAELELPKTQDQIVALRQHWATLANEHLADANIDATIDHRSNADRGITATPTIKMGWEATDYERQGIETIKGDINRNIRADNAELAKLETKIAVYQKILDATAPDPEPEYIEYDPAPAPAPKTEPVPEEPEPVRAAPTPTAMVVHTPVPDVDISSYAMMLYKGLHIEHDKIMARVEDDNLLNIDRQKDKFFTNAEYFAQALSNEFDDGQPTGAELDNIDKALDAVASIMKNIDDIDSDDVPQRDSAMAAYNDVRATTNNAIVQSQLAAPQPDPEPYPTPYDRPSSPWDR